MNSKGQNGSTLVGAVALGVIMAISIAGLMGVSRNTVSQEADAHDDARAFLAAESGLLTLTSWVMVAGTAAIVPRTGTETFDSVDVNLEIAQAPGMPADHWLLSSTVPASALELPYDKRLEWVIVGLPGVRPRPPSRYGAILSSNQMTTGIRNQHFDGPVHFNAPLTLNNISAGNGVRFRGPVSLHNNPFTTIGRSGNWNGHNDNKYGTGLIIPNGVSVGDLNTVFQSTYNAEAPFLGIKILPPAQFTRKELTDIAPLRTDGAANTLVFSVSGTGDAAVPSITFNGVSWEYARGTEYVFHVDAPLTVSHGTMLGKVTVETSANNNITINLTGGSLTYQWANSINSANGTTYNNMTRRPNGEYYEDVLAFYSGNDIIMNNTNSSFRALTAQLFAVERVESMIDLGTTDLKEIALFGTAGFNKYWNTDGHTGRTLFTGIFSETREPSAPAVVLVDEHGQRIIDGEDVEEDDIPDILKRMRWREINTI
jgi:hypothetical protein